MWTRASRGLAIGLLALVALAGCASANTKAKPAKAGAAKTKSATPQYYLALGDSYATGYQPTADGSGDNTDQGYASDIYTYEHRYDPGLQLVNMACPNESTTTMLTGVGNSAQEALWKCDDDGGSELTAAVNFLKTHHHKDEVPLVTIDIGANDVDLCPSASDVAACFATGAATISKETPQILDALRAAAPQGTKFVAMNLYDWLLALELAPASDPQQSLGVDSIAMMRQVNAAIQSADAAGGFQTADVADAFDTYDTSGTVYWNDTNVPKNVAEICDLTWACTPPPAGPSDHDNFLGYRVIAQTFEGVIGKL